MTDCSEYEDDPCYSSEDDWQEEEKKRNKRRLSSRLSKKPRVLLVDNLSSDEESEEKIRNKGRSRNGAPKKQKSPSQKSEDIEYINEEDPISTNKQEVQQQQQQSTTEFTSGSFVIAKADAHRYDSSNPPHIWRIDGKALLQKYEPFEEDGVLKYKNTSIYTGWSSLESDKYASIKDVNILLNTSQKFILSFNSNQLKDIIYDDSD